MRYQRLLSNIFLGVAVGFAAPGCATTRASTDHLPPVIDWHGASRDLVVESESTIWYLVPRWPDEGDLADEANLPEDRPLSHR